MNAPRPGFASGFMVSFASAFRTSLGLKRALVLVFVIIAPMGLGILARTFAPHPIAALNAIVLFLHLQLPLFLHL